MSELSGSSDSEFIFDFLVEFLESPLWTVPLNTFIDDHCLSFKVSKSTDKKKGKKTKTSGTDGEHSIEEFKIHKDFVALVDKLLTDNVKSLGVSDEQIVAAMQSTRADSQKARIVSQLFEVEDFLVFKRMMLRRQHELVCESMASFQRLRASQSQQQQQGKKGVVPAPSTSEEEKRQLDLAIQRSQKDSSSKNLTTEQEELQKAMALSMESFHNEQSTRSQEDQDLERAIALSLAAEKERLERVMAATQREQAEKAAAERKAAEEREAKEREAKERESRAKEQQQQQEEEEAKRQAEEQAKQDSAKEQARKANLTVRVVPSPKAKSPTSDSGSPAPLSATFVSPQSPFADAVPPVDASPLLGLGTDLAPLSLSSKAGGMSSLQGLPKLPGSPSLTNAHTETSETSQTASNKFKFPESQKSSEPESSLPSLTSSPHTDLQSLPNLRDRGGRLLASMSGFSASSSLFDDVSDPEGEGKTDDLAVAARQAVLKHCSALLSRKRAERQKALREYQDSIIEKASSAEPEVKNTESAGKDSTAPTTSAKPGRNPRAAMYRALARKLRVDRSRTGTSQPEQPVVTQGQSGGTVKKASLSPEEQAALEREHARALHARLSTGRVVEGDSSDDDF